jgi:hypothetical protein
MTNFESSRNSFLKYFFQTEMKRVYKSKEKRNLIPGENHSFHVLKCILLPDGYEYFILMDNYGEKHLLPAIYYKDYPILIHSDYTCHVDKINCQGRIFLEPEHPYYKTGKIYNFKFLELMSLTTKKGGEKQYFKMLGENGGNAYLIKKNSIDFDPDNWIKCKIAGIKKAKVFLELMDCVMTKTK